MNHRFLAVAILTISGGTALADEVCVTDTWGGFVSEEDGSDWRYDYLTVHCSEYLTVILTIDGSTTVYRSQIRGDQIKHYRRNTNNVSYEWCLDESYQTGVGCINSGNGDEPLGSARDN